MTDLAYVLRQLPDQGDPSLLGGMDFGDDAAIFRLSNELALVQTVDFFTPIVDDPYIYGQIAAANSLSDVYAVGGIPLTALNIVGFPVGTLPMSVLSEILRGGADKAKEAGVAIVGGHTIDDQEPKYGLAVTGTVHPERFLSGRGAKPGDVLLLTKPLGTGVIATALKAGKAVDADVAQAVRWMTTLNRDASSAMLAANAHAVSDITGFGLLGHLAEICRASGVSATVQSTSIPLLPGAMQYARDGFVPAGTRNNLTATESVSSFDGDLEDATINLLADPQTSGGLLICLPIGRVPDFVRVAGTRNLSVVIGQIGSGTVGQVSVQV